MTGIGRTSRVTRSSSSQDQFARICNIISHLHSCFNGDVLKQVVKKAVGCSFNVITYCFSIGQVISNTDKDERIMKCLATMNPEFGEMMTGESLSRCLSNNMEGLF